MEAMVYHHSVFTKNYEKARTELLKKSEKKSFQKIEAVRY